MDEAIAHFEDAYRLAQQADSLESILQMEEALGVAHLHKAEMDNGVQEHPGDRCLLQQWPAGRLARPADAEKAIAYFLRYLARKPDEREVWWLLNLAYMKTGGYPAQVPPAFLIAPGAIEAGAPTIGRFHDVASQSGIDSVSSAGGVVVDDFRGSGQEDVIVSSMDGCVPMRMFAANGDGTFTDRTADAGLADQLGGLNLAHADYDNDGCPDLVVLRGGWESLPQRKSLLRNDCHGRFTDVTERAGLGGLRSTQTAVWTDIDNDGWLDLFIANGAVNVVESQRGEPFPFRMRNQLFRNVGGRTFEELAPPFDRAEVSRGAAFGDVDNDGDTDIVYTNNNGSVRLLLNQLEAGDAHWAAVRLRQPSGNRFGLGARVGLERAGQPTLWRRIKTDGSYLSSVDPRVHFGLGSAAPPKGLAIVVEWPDGQKERWTDVKTDQLVTLERGKGR
jgi:hypothetical protein